MITRDLPQERARAFTFQSALKGYVDQNGAEVARAVNPFRRPVRQGKAFQHIKAAWRWLTMGQRGRDTEKYAYAATKLHGFQMQQAREFVREVDTVLEFRAADGPQQRDAGAPQRAPLQSEPKTFRNILGVGEIADMAEVTNKLAGLPKAQAMEIVEAAFPESAGFAGYTTYGAVLYYIEARLAQEGTFCFHSRYPSRDEESKAVTALFHAAGHPNLDLLNDEVEKIEAFRHMPRKLANLIVTNAEKSTSFKLARNPLFGVKFETAEWEMMVAAAKRPSQLEDLASLAIPTATAWRAICKTMELGQFANRQHDVKARESVAMEAISRVNLPYALLSAAGLDGVMKRAQGRVDAWRAVANSIGRPELAARFHDEGGLQELTKAANDYAASNATSDPQRTATILQLLCTARGEQTKGRNVPAKTREIDALAP